MPAPIRSWRQNANGPVMKMSPGTRPARSSRFDPGPGNGQTSSAGKIAAAAPPGKPGHPDISPRFRRSFAGQPEQVAQARHFVQGALAGCPAVTDAVLLTSELATNAVQHSATGRGGAFVVAISHAPGRVRVTVADGGSATHPAVAPADDELACSGRGLLLVDDISERWGYAGASDNRIAGGAEAGPREPGGAVWFELACS